MELACESCGAGLKVNPNLAGTRVSCPKCGSAVPIPKEATRRARRSAPPVPVVSRPRAPFTLWMLAAQLSLLALALAAFAGAFFRSGWNPAADSFFMESPFWLVIAGGLFLLLSAMVRRLPVLITLLSALLLLWICALAYRSARVVDASRVLALALALFAVWCALQHRKTVDESGLNR